MYHLLRALMTRARWRGSSLIAMPAALLLVGSLACAAAAAPTPVPAATATPIPRLTVVATTALLADITRNVAGDRAEITSIIPPGADAHSFQTKPSHSLAVGEADLIVSNGLGLDDFLTPVLASVQPANAVHVVATEGLTPEQLEERHLSEKDEHGHDDESFLDSVHEVIHEVEEGTLSAGHALEEVEALLGGHEHVQEEPSSEEEELVATLSELLHRAEDGAISAVEALEQIESLAESHHDTHLGHEMEELIHHSEEMHSGPSAILEELEELIHHLPEDEHEGLESKLMELAHRAEVGAITADEALEQMESLLEQVDMKGHDQHDHDDAHEDEHGHDHSAGDPHFWQDPIQTIHYVIRIRDGLIQADPANTHVYSTNAEAYIQELRALDQEIAQTLEMVPPEHRHLVTFHDAFGYFGKRYGWQVSAFVASDASDVTPGAVQAIINEIQSEGIPAIFAEPQFAPDVLEEVAKDTGIKVGVIHSMVDGTAPTYIDMMRANAKSLEENLG